MILWEMFLQNDQLESSCGCLGTIFWSFVIFSFNFYSSVFGDLIFI